MVSKTVDTQADMKITDVAVVMEVVMEVVDTAANMEDTEVDTVEAMKAHMGVGIEKGMEIILVILTLIIRSLRYCEILDTLHQRLMRPRYQGVTHDSIDTFPSFFLFAYRSCAPVIGSLDSIFLLICTTCSFSIH